jgi:lipid kinase YegS
LDRKGGLNLRNLTLVLNGKSCGRAAIRQAVSRMRAEGCKVAVHVTWEAGDAARFIGALPPDELSAVVAAGGDGTVNEVVDGLLHTGVRMPMAILPLGTANDFATSAGIPVHDPYEALRLAASGTATAVDVGVMNGRHFLNLAVGGFGAEVTTSTPIDLKNVVGGSAYALTAFVLAMKASPYRGCLVTPERRYECTAIVMAVGNGRQAGGGVQMTPKALIDDGLLDVLIVPDHDHARFVHMLTDLAELWHGSSSHFHYMQLAQFDFESEDILQVNLDGEPLSGRSFKFKVLPGALDLVLPDDCPLIGRSSI